MDDLKLQIVRSHKHTCANVQIGSSYEDKCDCGALDTAGKAIPDHSGEISALSAEIEKLRRENERLIEDRARFPDRPDDIGQMIGCHFGNLRAGKAAAEKHAHTAFSRATAAEAEATRLRAELERKDEALKKIAFLRPLGPTRNKLVEQMERIAIDARDVPSALQPGDASQGGSDA